jgi:hypothetical protein
MRTIQHFEIKKRGATVLMVPTGTQFMEAVSLRDSIALFGIIDTDVKQYERREIIPFFTGYDLPESSDEEEYRYLGTVVLNSDAPVHVFERVAITVENHEKDS